MKLSRCAILAPVPGRAEVLAVQPLTRQVALLDEDKARRLEALDGPEAPDGLDVGVLRQTTLVVDSDEEDRAALAEAYADYAAEVEATPTQLIVVPTFGCNLRCTYCYQELFEPEARGLIAPEVVEAFFAYVDQFHGKESPRPYVTLFGGEPLVDAPAHRDRLRRFLEGVRARGMTLAIVTNGYDVDAYADELGAGGVREIQVTIDGPQAIHDARRPHQSGRGTFARIVGGVDALVARHVPVNLRVVVDRDNLDALPALAEIAAAHGWLDLPETRFKTQVGRNYELFGCASRQRREALFDRVELWARYAELAEAHPLLRRFHRPRLHGIRHLAERGEFPVPNFDACPAAKKEWAFAPDGGLYGCTATVGNPRYRLGSFWPNAVRDEKAIAPWAERDALSISKCSTCSLAPVCGGGCGAIAAEQTGDMRNPDCRPVRELFGIGARFYRLGS